MEQNNKATLKAMIFIGNGFDVAHGYKTKYSEFYANSFELKELASNGNILCQHILDNVKGDLWQDLECGLYKYSQKITEKYGEGNLYVAENFKSELNSLKGALFRYLDKEQNKSIKENTGNDVDLLFSEWETLAFWIVSFNYTFCVANYTLPSEKKYDLNIDKDKLIYQHGAINNLDRGGFNVTDSIVLGIDDSQKVEKAHSFLYKSQQNIYDRQSLLKQMDDTAIFIVYGCSMGPSDDFYFRNMFKDKKDKLFIIYGFGEESLRELKKKTDEYCGGLYQYQTINEVLFVDSSKRNALFKTKKVLSSWKNKQLTR